MRHPLSLFLTLALLSPMAFAANARVCFEAEKPIFIQSPFRKGADKTASGGGYMELPWDNERGKYTARVLYKFTVKTPGLYYVWARTLWPPKQGNSIKISVNDDPPRVLGEDGTYGAWHWVGGRARVMLKAGENTLALHSNEEGARIDQFCLHQERDYNFSGRKVTK